MSEKYHKTAAGHIAEKRYYNITKELTLLILIPPEFVNINTHVRTTLCSLTAEQFTDSNPSLNDKISLG